jgi:hypothetical protein
MKKLLLVTGIGGMILAATIYGAAKPVPSDVEIPEKAAVGIILKSSDTNVDEVVEYVQGIKDKSPDTKVYIAYSLGSNRELIEKVLQVADGSIPFGKDVDDETLIPHFEKKIQANGAASERVKIKMLKPSDNLDYTFRDFHTPTPTPTDL